MTRLSQQSRTLVALSALLLAATFFLPLWKIELHAPQYPEGIGMLIRIDTLTGMKPADIDNLNGLNHYIGMKKISVDAFPALKIMPWVVGVFVACAFVISAVGRRSPLLAWLAGLALAGAAGFAEFYRWSYNYGHDLAPDAIIKVPGMTYQPPLLGSKQLLNFTATSWPDIGGWLAVAAFLIGVVAWWPQLRAQSIAARTATLAQRAGHAVAALVLVAVATACGSSTPPAIAYGQADCTVCHMRIVDSRYGAEVVTAKGKVNQFESIECLANYAITVTGLRSILVTDFDHPGTLVDAATARFVRKNGPAGEMGGNLLALSGAVDSLSIRQRFGTAPLSWADVRQLAERDELSAQKIDDARHTHEH